MKVSHFSEVSWSLFQHMAHTEQHIAQEAACDCLDSPCAHPRIVRLRSLRGLVDQGLAGDADLQGEDLKPLAEFIAELRVAPTTERPVDGLHARTSKRGNTRPSHTEAFQSYGLRIHKVGRFVPDDLL